MPQRVGCILHVATLAVVLPVVGANCPIQGLGATNDLKLVALLFVAVLKIGPENTVAIIGIDGINHVNQG